MWASQLWQPLGTAKDVARDAVTGSKKWFQKKISSTIQTIRRQREGKCWSEVCVWVLWYDESVIAGLDLSQSWYYKETSFTLLLWPVIAVWNQRWCLGPCEVIRLVGVCYEMKACGLFAGCESKKQQRERLRGTERTRETQMSATQISRVVMVAASQPLDLSALAFSSSFSPSERLKSSSVGEREFRRNPKLLPCTHTHTYTERWHHQKVLDWMSTESREKENHWSRDWDCVLCMCWDIKDE